MTWFMRVMVVLIVSAVTVAATAPLGFLLDRLSNSAGNLQWSQVQGTVWTGRVSNVTVGRQIVGDLELRMQPVGLIAAALVYEVKLLGPVISGSANVEARGGRLKVDGLNAIGQVERLIGLNASVRQVGGAVRLRDVSIEVDRDLNCIVASGELSTDVLVNLGAQYGEVLPELQGTLTCVGSLLSLSLEGGSDTGVFVEISTMVGVRETSSLNARISGASGEITQALIALGFTDAGDDFVYVRELGP